MFAVQTRSIFYYCNGTWNTITLIDKNGSFRGEARFESEKEAFKYLEEYKKRMKSPQELKVFPEP
jgi:hypothetical protein